MSFDIRIPEPGWNSPVASTILELEKLRTIKLGGSLPPRIFFQIKQIFQRLETLGSARIEGNNTTLSEYVEKIIDDADTVYESEYELRNLNLAINYIEENTDQNTVFDRRYISDLHIILTKNLTPPPNGEGSKSPGQLRSNSVSIHQSAHIPPFPIYLFDHFSAFLDFINQDHLEQNQLLMAAIAHHRFMYIHPFDNGNGRLGRLLTYAFLIKLGFNVQKGRIINPSSVFYSDRDKYYEMLAVADTLTDEGLLDWSNYFLGGLKNQIDKIDHLLDVNYTRDELLIPAFQRSLDRQHITRQEFAILTMVANKEGMKFKAADLDEVGILGSQNKSIARRKLQDKKMIQATTEGGRTYTIHFANSYLLRSIISVLGEKGFVAEFLNNN